MEEKITSKDLRLIKLETEQMINSSLKEVEAKISELEISILKQNTRLATWMIAIQGFIGVLVWLYNSGYLNMAQK